jgi:putative transposase
MMQLVEKHLIRRSDARYIAIDRASFASKNLYNAALYEVRQYYIFTGEYLNYNALDKVMQKHEAYRALPTKGSQQVLRLLDKNWASFFAALRAYRDEPSRFKGRPKLPGYKDKQEGRNILVYTIQAISQPALRKGIIKPSQLDIEIHAQHRNVDQVRIIPKRDGTYVVEVVYTKQEEKKDLDPYLVAAIDIGVNNLVALTSNKCGFIPRIVNGRPIKSINQYYNKQIAKIQTNMSHNHHTSRELERVASKRTRRIDHYLHASSKRIIDFLVSEQIGTLVIGKNPGWKQEANMSKKNNQHFVQLPHARFIDMMTYKAQLFGIQVIVNEESYTSKASFLDMDDIPTYGKANNNVFSGKRVKRGMYKSRSGKLINADINGSYNILRKALPNAFGNGIEDMNMVISSLVVHPVRIVVPSKPELSRIR